MIFYTEALLDHAESLGVPVIDPWPRTGSRSRRPCSSASSSSWASTIPPRVVVNHRDQVLKALDAMRFPLS